ncbi:MAG TPA: FAD:protein FMN transferase [Micromonosporaceae bacterium]
MGMPVSLHLSDPLPAHTLDRLAAQVFAWLHEVDRRFSTFRHDSEVNRLARGETSLADCSADLRLVLDACADLWRDTEGYFDVYATGALDPSGFVKGWAVQVASDRLLAAGCPNHCLNAGGDVRVRGHQAPGQPWRIGVRHPRQADRVCWVLEGTDLAVATSGTYERGHHVVDPHRGTAAAGLCSVTVVGTDLGRADAYATAGVAMGRAGLTWLADLVGYRVAVVADDGTAWRSDDLPLAPPA